ncbi:hypothetical protein Zm00014a_001824 [Zea mays]|uniref:Formin-like protein 18 n=1 Tax=Zea mays TaxID=4577 RepID=A0A3L6E3Y7_MAIZE|nr:hypothetical protein Zm00014a_001824 [Zea mays]
MDPCPFVRVLVGNLALKMPASAPPAAAAAAASGSGVHPATPPCYYCRIRLNKLPYQTAPAPLLPATEEGSAPAPAPASCAAAFHASKADLDRAAARPALFLGGRLRTARLKVAVYAGRGGGEGGGRLLGKLVFRFDLRRAVAEPFVFLSGWSVQSDSGAVGPRNWLAKLWSERERERAGKERKGWSVTVHDLSGSPVALASMVTPFVASPGTDRVGRSNPGGWLILRRRVDGTWTPWGRLECWRDRGGSAGDAQLGYRFELVPDHNSNVTGTGVCVAESGVPAARGGRFAIDLTTAGSPGRGSGELGRHALWPPGGFVMSAAVQGEGRRGRPSVEIGVAHVGCAEDAAAFVALAAAVDLSMDACRLFSCKLRRELSA